MIYSTFEGDFLYWRKKKQNIQIYMYKKKKKQKKPPEVVVFFYSRQHTHS